MKRLNSILENLYRVAVSAVGMVALSIIFAMSIICTCYKTCDSNEDTFFVDDSVAKNVLGIVVFLLILFVLNRKKVFEKLGLYLEDEIKYKKIKKLLLCIILGLSCVWVLFTQYVPGADQADVLDCAHKLYAKEYNMLEPGGYLNKWPNQVGPAVVDFVLARIWGDFNVVAMQLLNAVGLTLLYKKIVEILDTWKVARVTQIITLGVGVLFLPMIMYTSFVYGTIWHLTLALVAFHSSILFIETGRWSQAVVSVLTMALSIIVKTNAMIFLMAIVIYHLVGLFAEKRDIAKKLILVASICILSLSLSKLPTVIVEKQTGYKLDQGVSNLGFIAMGLQDGEFAPGWWNGYSTLTYERAGYNTAKQDIIAKKEISNRLNEFTTDKAYGYRFFTQKIASMWAEPTFQCFWLNQLRLHRVKTPGWINSLMNMKGYVRVAEFFDYFQVIIYLGGILWLICGDKKKFNTASFFVLSFCGGFLFHIFWEAKTQYSVTYMVLLLPCAVMGYKAFLEKLEVLKAEGGIKNLKLRYGYGLLSIAVIIMFMVAYKGVGDSCITCDTGDFIEYVASVEPLDTDESMLEVNIMKSAIENHIDFINYLESILLRNGVSY